MIYKPCIHDDCKTCNPKEAQDHPTTEEIEKAIAYMKARPEIFPLKGNGQKLDDPISKEQIEECKHCGHEGRREEGGRCPKKPHTYHDYEPKDSNHLKTAYQEVIADLKKSFDTCKDYDENCIECRAKKARELLEEVVSLGFE